MILKKLVYSLPLSQSFDAMIPDQSGDCRVYLRSFEGKEGLLTFSTKHQEWTSQMLEGLSLNNVARGSTEVLKSNYLKKVEEGISFSKKHGGKVVFSRWRDHTCNELDLFDALQALRQSFPNAFVYLLELQDQVWMGATPESLFTKSGEDYQTMALAGTKWNDDPFTEKEYLEQQVVTDAIMADLSAYHPQQSEVYEDEFGILRHLRTDIKWRTSDHLESAIDRIYPTPAICGLPKPEAFRLIEQQEGYERGLYSGLIGVQAESKKAELFVNLRCMQLFSDRVRLYAGGGINAQSLPEVEWEEIQRKMNAVTDAVGL